jgi:hypothetical protein
MIIFLSIMNEIFSSLFSSNDQTLTDFICISTTTLKMNLSIYTYRLFWNYPKAFKVSKEKKKRKYSWKCSSFVCLLIRILLVPSLSHNIIRFRQLMKVRKEIWVIASFFNWWNVWLHEILASSENMEHWV